MSADASTRRTELFTAIVLLVLAAVFTCDHDAWFPDEPRVLALSASVARGSVVVPRLDAATPWLEQPPLYYWAAGGAMRALGEDASVARAVSSLFGLAALALTYLYTAKLAGRRAGALAALALGLSQTFFSIQHRIVVDSALTACVAGSAYASVRALTAERARERLVALFFAYACASLAYLSKGVVGIGLSGFAFLGVAIARRSPRDLVHVWMAPFVFALVTGLYHWRVFEEVGKDGLYELVVRQTFGRAVGRSVGVSKHIEHEGHLHDYLVNVWVVFLPSTLPLVAAAVDWVKRRGELSPEQRFALAAPAWWFGLGFVALSVVTSKRSFYLTPILPPLATICGIWLDDLVAGKKPDLAWVSTAASIIIIVAAPLLPVASIIIGAPWVLPAAGGAIALLAGVAALRRRADLGRSLATSLAGGVAAFALASVAVVPWWDGFNTLGPFLRAADRTVPAEQAVHVLFADESTRGALELYAHRTGLEVVAIPDLHRLARQRRDLWLLVVERREGRHSGIEIGGAGLGVETVLEEKGHPLLGGRRLRLLRVKVKT